MLQLFRSLPINPPLPAPVVAAVGNFDGVHRGHAEILRALSKSDAGSLVVVSFYPHPAQVLGKVPHVPLLNTLRQKCSLLEALGVTALVNLFFTKKFAQIEAEEFIDEILIRALGVETLAIGPDARIGKGGKGDAQFILSRFQQLGRKAQVVPFTLHGGERVSSGRIRTVLAKGAVEEACELLGRPYALMSFVTHGFGRGNTIGIPTLNLAPNKQLLPARGVYATWVYIHGEKHRAVTNVGIRPTFAGSLLVVESHLFESPKANYYGERVEVLFLKRIRDELKFSSAQALVAQIQRDIGMARSVC